MTLAPGTTLGSYKIVGPIGSGGMGEVYRARDTKLGRDVAIKVLPVAMALDPEGLARFTREARAVAALNHPNIVTIFSTEEADGMRFMTMELIEGRTLKGMIPAGGLPLGEFFDIAIALLDAVSTAHQKGITHRDLKPGNIMIAHDGRLKVLDFGLALPSSADSGEVPSWLEGTDRVETKAGVILGTAAYMSPEQLQRRVLDHRTDLFSLGVILYEMSTGTRPFRGASLPELLRSIMSHNPKLIHEVRTSLPTDLSLIVSACLAKEPGERPQSVHSVLTELKGMRRAHEVANSPAEGSPPQPRVAAPGSADLRVAVIPFVPRSDGPEAEALALGLTEDITEGLTRFPHMRVVSRRDARKFKAPATGEPDGRKDLGARYLIGGQVRALDAAVRISAHLVDAETGVRLWAETYDRPLTGADLFTLQDDVTHRVVAAVADQSGVLVRAMGAALRDRPCDGLPVADLVLRCYALQAHDRPEEHAQLRSCLERALEREPLEANGWACLAGLYHQERSAGFNPLPDTGSRHRRAAERAVELDPGCQNGWREIAVAHHFFSRDLSALRVAAERVVSLNPLNTSPVAMVGMLLSYAGDWERGIEIVRQAIQPNPNHPPWYHFPVAMYHYMRHEYEGSLAAAKRINMPAFAPSFLLVAAAAGQLGRREEAKAAFQHLEAVAPDFLETSRSRAYLAQWVWDEQFLEHLVEGILKGKALAEGSGDSKPSSPPSLEPIQPGTFLGPYEITSRLGAGGMGEVWCARDNRLGRDVAIKIIPPEIAHDADRLRRFELEARAASQLNHPNVLVVYDIGARDGAPYLVFELLTGETLKEVIARGPVSQKVALDYGRQMVRGLSAAHGAGIVHRDLKPANVFVTRDGGVKILDFGLAKVQPATSPEERTGTVEYLTGEGAVMGTPGYMSPEQIRGERVDVRSDLFSLGVVLYEMLSGKRAFAKRSGIETLNATLTEQPADLVELAPGIDTALATVVMRCLEKKPEDRFQSAKDLGLALETLTTTSGPRAIAAQRGPNWRLVAAGLIAIALAGGGLSLRQKPQSLIPPTYRQITSDGHSASADLSPDGETITYVSTDGQARRLMVRDLSGGAPVELFRTPSGPMSAPRWSHSGKEIAVGAGTEVLVISRFGGEPVRMSTGTVFRLSWAPDDSELFVGATGAKWFWRASPRTLQVRRIEIDGPFLESYVTDVSPDGERLLVNVLTDTAAAVWSMRKDGTDLREHVREGRRIRDSKWDFEGDSFFYLVGNAVTELKRARVLPDGPDPSPEVAESSLTVPAASANAAFGLSRNGRLAYARATFDRNLWRADVSSELSGESEIALRAVTNGTRNETPRFSPDATQLAFARQDGELGEIILANADGGAQTVVVSRKGVASAPVWSPDGQGVAYWFNEGKGAALHVVNTQTREDRLLIRIHESSFLEWAPGSQISYRPRGSWNFMLADPATGVGTPLLDIEEGTSLFSPRASTRGDRVALHYNARTKKGIVAMAIVSPPDRHARLVPGTEGAVLWPIGWSADDTVIFAVDQTAKHLVAVRTDGGGVRKMGALRVPEGLFGDAFEAGGKLKLVFSYVNDRSDIWVIDNFDPRRP
jgi:serine/threonine protein kinase/tetratricopeptide (TPR) repeat protein